MRVEIDMDVTVYALYEGEERDAVECTAVSWKINSAL